MVRSDNEKEMNFGCGNTVGVLDWRPTWQWVHGDEKWVGILTSVYPFLDEPGTVVPRKSQSP